MQASSEFRIRVQEPCTKISFEAGKALKELASSVNLFIYPSSSAKHIQKCKNAVEEVSTMLQASMVGEWEVLDTIPIITITSVLIDIVKCIERIFAAIEELSQQANFEMLLDKSKKQKQRRHDGVVASQEVVTVIIHKSALELRDVEDHRG